ncbi:MAG: hypothetical protein K2Q32_02975, partial [Alphaproteobacteria bacterium]|nr:hypothetical protein [Alphaproteobacteria bacterium]
MVQELPHNIDDPVHDKACAGSARHHDLLVARRQFMQLAAGAFIGLSSNLFLPQAAIAQTLASLDKGLGQVPGRKPKPPRLVMIDPGHGGHDPGA